VAKIVATKDVFSLIGLFSWQKHHVEKQKLRKISRNAETSDMLRSSKPKKAKLVGSRLKK
jgi:hypothetical protein